jgi:hypothetical protein
VVEAAVVASVDVVGEEDSAVAVVARAGDAIRGGSNRQ